MGSDTALYLSAEEAAAELGVSRATLYAYVSRGKLRSVARAGTRSRLYLAEDVRALLGRGAALAGGAKEALAYGGPVLDSAITLIADHGLYYRGRDALRLAGAQSLESVATLIWDCAEDPFDSDAPDLPRGLGRLLSGAALGAVDRAAAVLSFTGPRDAFAHNFTPSGLVHTGARIIRHLSAAVLGAPATREPIHGMLARGWGVDRTGADLLRSALVLCADHELNASTFAVRVVASTKASLYRAVSAGLAALTGPEHGGMTERTDALLTELLATGDPGAAIVTRLRRGDPLPGFGHPLYPKGDPRARLLLRRIHAGSNDDALTLTLRATTRAARTYAGLHPTLDFALSCLAYRLALPMGSALGLFAIGRSTGWIGHALEQYRTGALIRPRARYVGEHPG